MSNYDKLKLTYEDGRQDSITLTSDTIEYGAYQRRHIVSVEVPEIVKVIGGYAFCDNNSLANIVLNEGLERIEGQAFQHGVYTAITIPSTVRYIGNNSFNISLEQHEGLDSFTITCLATTPPELEDFEGITFGYRSCISAIYVPDESVSLYQEAWRDYADKIQGGAHPIYMVTNLDISAAYVGVDAVAKVYLGTDVVWELAPSDPCEGLTGESLCNCQGRYWWGGECHDEPEPEPVSMESIPLTFEITSVGTEKTGSIGLRLSGDTSESNKRKVTYYLYHEGTETTGNLNLNEAVSNKSITSMITGLTVGDKIEFWGLNDQRGLSVSEKAFEYFVVTSGLKAKVYGNVNSLLFNGTTYHGQPVPQTGETDAYTFYRLFTGKSGFTFGAPDEPQHIVLPVPANGLQDSIYREMFSGCTGMTTPPKLPATTLAPSCYRSMFSGCKGIITAPELPAITMADYAYLGMFSNCTSLAQAPSLPATTLASYCYGNMFGKCTSLTQAPALPVTTLADYCYYYMFTGCTSLTTAPELPATELASYCYQYMFADCTNLTTAPELPATTLANNCYQYMFQGCTSLTTAPELPATTLAGACYGYMFKGCTKLTTAPALPVITLASGCYYSMFAGCTNLTAAPVLPATALTPQCYEEMFSNCTSLTQAPELPATKLASYCYSSMFKSCKSLTTAPALPATRLESNCYEYMFNLCTSLTKAPALPATTLATSCYYAMFFGCSNLTTAPALPATTLASGCYYYMFSNCKSLRTAPTLPATKLADNCYRYMFQGCSNLSYVKCLATDISATNCTQEWLNGVASSGSFYKHPNATWTTGISGIPKGWTVKNATA